MQYNIKEKVQKLINLFGYKITKLSHPDPIIDKDEKFIRIYNICKPYTLTSKEKMYALYKAVQYAINANISGDFVECGVWEGGSTMLIAYTLLDMEVKDRKIVLYDTFEGMTKPTEIDYDLNNMNQAGNRWKIDQKDDHNDWCYASIESVKKNMSGTKYPENNLIYVKGKVEETIPNTMSSRISLLRLDTDWYESSKHELVHLFPLISKNGVLIIDDYGAWAGQKKAIDEYFSNKPILLDRIDDGGRIGIKI